MELLVLLFRYVWRRPLLMLLVGLLLLGFTSTKLYRMAKIRGWVEGATVTQKRLTDKRVMAYKDRRGKQGSYWVAWDGGDIGRPGPHRTNVEREMWTAMQVGDVVEIVMVPGDERPQLRAGIFASDGNLVFDFVLIGLEIVLCLVCAGRLLVQLQRTLVRPEVLTFSDSDMQPRFGP